MAGFPRGKELRPDGQINDSKRFKIIDFAINVKLKANGGKRNLLAR
jgi:hypothetical protein